MTTAILLDFSKILFYIKYGLNSWIDNVSDGLVYLLLFLVMVLKLKKEVRTTLLDVSWHFEFMDLSDVICYVSISIKALKASNLVAFESLLAKMSILVLNLVAFGWESSAAILTLKRFIARMNPLMKKQISQVPKLLAANPPLIVIQSASFMLRLAFKLIIGIHNTYVLRSR